MIVIGYSGHAYVACSILKAAGRNVTAYCDQEEKSNNPFGLQYLGTESSAAALQALQSHPFFIAIGNNGIRKKVYGTLRDKGVLPLNAIHPSAVICPSANIAANGVMIAAGALIQPLAYIGNGVICNTGSIIEHECRVGDFAHIGPGTVLCGNVTVGENSFIGAGAVVRQGIRIGSNCIIGAGAVVIKDVPEAATVFGVPAR